MFIKVFIPKNARSSSEVVWKILPFRLAYISDFFINSSSLSSPTVFEKNLNWWRVLNLNIYYALFCKFTFVCTYLFELFSTLLLFIILWRHTWDWHVNSFVWITHINNASRAPQTEIFCITHNDLLLIFTFLEAAKRDGLLKKGIHKNFANFSNCCFCVLFLFVFFTLYSA